MAAGDVFNGRLAVTSARATLDALVGAGPKVYSFVALRRIDGAPFMGNATVTSANGFEFIDIFIQRELIIGANINLIGPATVEFLGITSA